MLERKAIIDYLASCAGAELAGILAAALARRPENTATDSLHEKLLLAQFSMEKPDDDAKWENAQLSLVAQADGDYYDASWQTGNGEAFLQAGLCPKCQLPLVSHAKHVTCPICASKTVLT